MRWFSKGLALGLCLTVAAASGQTLGPPGGSSSGGATPGGTSGQIQTNNGAGGFGALANPLPAANGGTGEAGTITGALKGNGTSAATQAACADLSNAAAGCAAASAAKADEQAGTSATLMTTPSQQQQHDSAAKAWAFCSAVGATNASYNATCANTGTGAYTVTFTTPFATANYACLLSDMDASNRFLQGNVTSTTVFTVGITNITGVVTNTAFGIVCFGRQ
jgi:hypothetical protein